MAPWNTVLDPDPNSDRSVRRSNRQARLGTPAQLLEAPDLPVRTRRRASPRSEPYPQPELAKNQPSEAASRAVSTSAVGTRSL